MENMIIKVKTLVFSENFEYRDVHEMMYAQKKEPWKPIYVKWDLPSLFCPPHN